MNQCKSCEAYISKRAKYCKPCSAIHKKEKSKKINPKWLVRGSVSTGSRECSISVQA